VTSSLGFLLRCDAGPRAGERLNRGVRTLRTFFFHKFPIRPL
jgi:hypothetical protein